MLSPMVFNLYVENLFVEALEDTKLGIKENGIPINNIGYDDDTIIITDKIEDQQLLLNTVDSIGRKYDLKINNESKTYDH